MKGKETVMKQISRFGIVSISSLSGLRFRHVIAMAVIALAGRPDIINAQTLTKLHSFGAFANDGQSPGASLILVGTNVLCGTTSAGGGNNFGTVFAINTDGLGYTNLHEFGATGDGRTPQASLILVDSTLYGTATVGGSNNFGTVFAINTDGSGYTNLHQFGSTGDGQTPEAALTLVGSMLYGTTYGGGTNGKGTVFAMNTDGSGYTNLYLFGSTVANDGQNPWAPLTAIGSRLYGTTYNGGAFGKGIVFAMNTDGSDYAILYPLGHSADGQNPRAPLTLVGTNALYGTTFYGGSIGAGTVFAITPDGLSFTNLHQFESSGYDGLDPWGLTLGDSTLYGTTYAGGTNGSNYGTIFAMNTNGLGYTILYQFGATATDARTPKSALILVGTNTLYGTTFLGGDFGAGTVFKFTIPTNSSAAITCVLAPSLATNTVGTAHTVTATVTSNDTAKVGALVNFSVTAGPNLGHSGTATTSVSGQGSFTYTGTIVGIDTIRAISLNATGTATKVWIAAPCPTITLSPSTLPDGASNALYQQTITATGGTPPRSFAITARRAAFRPEPLQRRHAVRHTGRDGRVRLHGRRHRCQLLHGQPGLRPDHQSRAARPAQLRRDQSQGAEENHAEDRRHAETQQGAGRHSKSRRAG